MVFLRFITLSPINPFFQILCFILLLTPFFSQSPNYRRLGGFFTLYPPINPFFPPINPLFSRSPNYRQLWGFFIRCHRFVNYQSIFIALPIDRNLKHPPHCDPRRCPPCPKSTLSIVIVICQVETFSRILRIPWDNHSKLHYLSFSFHTIKCRTPDVGYAFHDDIFDVARSTEQPNSAFRLTVMMTDLTNCILTLSVRMIGQHAY